VLKGGRDLLRRWLDSVERQLVAEAERAGIFQHPTMTGEARARVLRNALTNILPQQVAVGTGRVIGADSELSKQIDIVVFDGRFPTLRMDTEALYPVEGVIATIEVKSELNDLELQRAMSNASSVMRIAPSFVKEDADAWIFEQTGTGATDEQAFEAMQWHLMPRTYVYAYSGLMSRDSQSAALKHSLESEFLATPSRPLIPSVIVGGAAVTVALGGAFAVKVEDEHVQRQLDTLAIAITFESASRFGVLACHLLWHLENRTLMLEPPGTIRRSIQSYLPFSDYINDCLQGGIFSATFWQERSAWTSNKMSI